MALALVLRREHVEAKPRSDYSAEIKMTTTDPATMLLLSRGRVKRHVRSEGWEALVVRYVIQNHRDLVKRMLRDE